jgi:hypothetical protein
MFCLEGDVMMGGFIKMIQFPANTFALTDEQVVATHGNVVARIAADPSAPMLPNLAGGDPDTESIRTRMLMQVPYKYLPLVLNR